MNFKIISAVVYQFVILLTLVALTIYFAVVHNQLNDLLVGSLIGVMMGISIKPNEDIDVRQVNGKDEE